jgi:hypothetical protein
MKIAKTLLTAATVLALIAPAGAQASKTQESVFQDDATLLYSSAETREASLDELDALGVDTIRALVVWSRVAPDHTSPTKPAGFDATDPNAYPQGAWDRWDALVQSAQARGIQVLLTPTGPIPGWASDCRGTYDQRRICRPNPTEFGNFVTAVAKRYPSVKRWSIWNEPNLGSWLTPQYSVGSKGALPEAPHRYRSLVQSATSALRSNGHSSDQILLGETAPIGKTSGDLSTRSVQPVVFWRELFCLDSKGKALSGSNRTARGCPASYAKLRVNGAAHHPYTRAAGGKPTSTIASNDITLVKIDRLSLWLDRGAKAKRIPSGLPIYITEYGFQTNPPDEQSGVSLTAQALYIAQSDYLAWGNSRIRSVAQYELFDEPALDTFQTGLRFVDGRAKPGLDAYRTPVWPFEKNGYRYVWAMVRGATTAQPATVEYASKSSGPWKRVRTVTVDRSHRFIYLKTKAKGPYFRVVHDGKASRVVSKR